MLQHLELVDVAGRTLKLDLELVLAVLHTIVVALPGGKLHLDVFLLSEARAQFKHGALQLDDGLLALAQAHLEFVDLELVGGALLIHFSVHLFLQSSHLVDVILVALGHLLPHLLDGGLQLRNLLQQTVLVLLLQLGVLLDLLSCLGQLDL